MITSPNVFISWSGERSRRAAKALWDWLPTVVQAAKPWMSEIDIDKGSRWFHEIAKALEGARIGISCLTAENLQAPWMLFEAGALSKTIDRTRLCTYLLGTLRPQDVSPPLSMFQATRAEKDETRKLVHTINRALHDDPIPEPRFNALFDAMWPWPQLDATLGAIPLVEPVEAKRTVEDMILEILEATRAQAISRRKTDFLESYLPVFQQFLPFLDEALRAAKRASPRLDLTFLLRRRQPNERPMPPNEPLQATAKSGPRLNAKSLDRPRECPARALRSRQLWYYPRALEAGGSPCAAGRS